jgi:hypothetical protein
LVNILEGFGIKMNTNDIRITTFLNEIVDGAVEKYVVREYNNQGTVVRTRQVSSKQDAENVKLEWQKQSS